MTSRELQAHMMRRINATRHQQKRKIAEFAEECGLCYRTYYLLKAGTREITFRHLLPMCRVLGLNMGQLITEAEKAGSK